MNSIDYQLELARHIFPGHAFFGFEDPMHLCVPVGGCVDCISVGIESHVKDFLNLGGISLIGASGETLELSETLASARLSSAYSEELPQDILNLLVKRKPIHSGYERRPSLMLEFREPTELKSIKIANRSGRWGRRSRDLTFRAWLGKNLIIDFRNNCDASLRKRASALIDQLKVPLLSIFRTEGSNSTEEIRNLALEIRGRTIDELVAGSLNLPTKDLCALLPIYDLDKKTDDGTMQILGEIIARLVEVGNGMSTVKLRDFQSLMTSPTEIESIRRYASDSLERRSGKTQELVFSKHHIAIGGSSLMKRGEEYLSALQLVQRQLHDWSITSMICYGTLLGAVRDGRFIEHDDDVDMLIIDDSTTREGMIKNADDLIKRLQSEGFKAKRAGMNFHVIPPDHNVTVDVFPSWHDNDGHWVMMERGNYRNIPIECLQPVKSVELQGQQFVCPNDSAAFLAYRYGSNWQVADPFHEWPWPLVETSESLTRLMNTQQFQAS